MITFKQIDSGDDIKEVLKSAFDIDLPVSGGWGYDKESATIIEPSQTSKKQLQFTFASMRAYIEMNLTQKKDSRYGGINLKELSCEVDKEYEKVTYEITGMLESTYAKFIKEYKENFQSTNFNMSEHFEKRKENTLTRIEVFWFTV